MGNKSAKKAESNEAVKQVNILVCGPPASGKTCFIDQYVQNALIIHCDAGPEEIYRKKAKIDGEDYMLDILEIAGYDQNNQDYGEKRDAMEVAEAFIIVYDITRADTFEHATNTYKEIQVLHKRKAKKPVVVFFGNKTDRKSEQKVFAEETTKWLEEIQHSNSLATRPKEEAQKKKAKASPQLVMMTSGSCKIAEGVTQAVEMLVRAHQVHFQEPQAASPGGALTGK